MFTTFSPIALAVATAATLALVASIYIGSRNLGNFDPALVAYLFGCIFAWFGVVYRYTVWLRRPPTWRYFARGWQLYLADFPLHTWIATLIFNALNWSALLCLLVNGWFYQRRESPTYC